MAISEYNSYGNKRRYSKQRDFATGIRLLEQARLGRINKTLEVFG